MTTMLAVDCHNKILETEGLHGMFTALYATVANPQVSCSSPASPPILPLDHPTLELSILRSATPPDFVCVVGIHTQVLTFP